MNSDSAVITENTDAASQQTLQRHRVRGALAWAQRSLRWVMNRMFRAAAELVAVGLGAGIIWLGLLTSIMAKGEADVSFLKHNFSLWFAQAYEGQDADIENFKVKWNPERESIGLLASNISVKDDLGTTLLSVGSLYTETPISALINKGFEARRLDLNGGQFTIKRDEKGAIFGAIGGPDAYGRLGPIIPIASGAGGSNGGDFIDAVALNGTDVFIRDELFGLELDLNKVNFETNISDQEILANGAAELILANMPDAAAESGVSPRIKVTVRRERIGNKALDVDIEVTGFNPAHLRLKDGVFHQLNQADIPLNLMLNWREVKDQTRQAKFNIAKYGKDISSVLPALGGLRDVSLVGTMDVMSDNLSLEAVNLVTRDVQFKAQGDISGLIAQREKGNVSNPVSFDVNIEAFNGIFDDILVRPLAIKKGRVTGDYDMGTGRLNLSNAYLPINNYAFKAQGELKNWLGKAGKSPSLKLTGGFEGTLEESDLLALWPKSFILGGRNWVKSSIVAATLSDMKFDVDISDFSKLEGGLPDDAVKLDFQVNDGVVQYIRTMTPLDRASGFGQLRANGIDMTLTRGRVGKIILDKGRVEIPQFFPYGNDFTIEFEGRGPVDYMVELIDQKPFEYASLYNLSPQSFSGQAHAKLKITRPLRENFDQSRIQYEVDVTATNVNAPFGVGDYNMTNGALFLSADKTGMTIKGPAQIGPLAVDINWHETFDFGATPAELTLSGRLDSAAFDKFGISLREYFGGVIPFTLNATGQGIDFDNAKISANLSESEWVIGDVWSKRIGAAGSLDLLLTRSPGGAIMVDDFKASAPGLDISGALRLDKNMRLLEASLGQVSVEDFVDARVTLSRETTESPLQATLSGDYLNLDGFIGPALWQSGGDAAFPLTVSANLNSLRLAPSYQISKANLVYNNSGSSIEQFRFLGGTESGLVKLDLRTLGDGPFSSRLIFDVANASDVATAFFDLDNITGGRLYGEAVRPREGDSLIWSGTLNIDDFTLVKAPFLAQILSLASLDGLGDVLTGEGLNFKTVDLPFTWGNGVLGLEGARAVGPALGLTGDGQIDVRAKLIDVDGTLIPAYSANSILGSIPLLGDLFGGNADNATLGLTYGVKGSFGEAQVAINPLSALTPGILRRIFKPEREKKRIDIPSDTAETLPADAP